MVKPRENRVPMMLSNDELEAIDDWRFKTRVATRSEAIRRLCKLALILDARMEGLFDYRLRALGSVAQLGEAISYEPSDNTENAVANAWNSIRATEALMRSVDEKRKSPESAAAAFEEAALAISDLTGRIKELSDAMITLRMPSKIEEAFLDIEVNTEIWNRMLGRPSDFAHLTIDELVDVLKNGGQPKEDKISGKD